MLLNIHHSKVYYWMFFKEKNSHSILIPTQIHGDKIWIKLEWLSSGLKYDATFSFLYLFYPLGLTLYSHPRKWVFFYSPTVALKDASVICSSKIGYVFGGRRSAHFGTKKWKKRTLAFVPFQVIYFTQQVSLIGLGVYFAQWAKIDWLQKVLRSARLTLIQKQQLSNQ